MKLMTEMSHSNSWHAPRAVGFAIEEDDERDQFRHDAAAAHALMHAIRDAFDEPCVFPAPPWPSPAWIETRADEIMREWGFGQEWIG